MSASFSVQSITRLEPAVLAPELGYDKVSVYEHEDEGVTHFFIENLSCRSVDLYYLNDTHVVEIQDCSSLNDYELGLRLIDVIAKQTGSPIVTFDGQRFSPEQFSNKYNIDWIEDDSTTTCLEAINNAAKLRSGTISLWGAEREFHLGPRLARELLSIDSDVARVTEFFDLFHATQWIDTEKFFVPNILVMPATDNKVVAWAGDVEYYFPPVDYVAIIEEDESSDPVFIPYEKLEKLMEGRFQWLDEQQSVVLATSAADWPALVDRARSYKVDPRIVCGEPSA